MTIITHDMVWNVDNVRTYRGYDVDSGEVSLSDDEWASWLTEVYGTVDVCGQTFDAGDAFKDLDPTAFECSKSDHEDRLQAELEQAIDNEDESDIVWNDYDPCDIDESAEDDE